MVSFHDNPEKYDNPIIMEQLNEQMFSCIEIDKKLKEMDRSITLHPQYIQKCQSNSLLDDNTTDPIIHQSSSSILRQTNTLI